MKDLRLPSHLQNVISQWPAPNYTTWTTCLESLRSRAPIGSRIELRRLQCDLTTCFKIMVLTVLDRRNFLLIEASKLHVVILLNCMCNTVELMPESISLVRVW